MKSNFRDISLADLCSWFGVTRQAFYQSRHRSLQIALEQDFVLDEVYSIREKHRCLGGRKLFSMLKPFLKEHQLKMGRDAFFDLLRDNGLLVKKRKQYHVTTNSRHWMRKYPNLIRDIVPTGPNQIWVSDITYWKINGRHYYISFVTDAYSRKIVGYQIAQTMEAIESVAALKMALKDLDTQVTGLVHHSDRGSQYCSAQYVKLLNRNKIQISMTENGDPLENAIAERINGIIKGEYLFDREISCLKSARKVLKSVVALYNDERPHSSISNLMPSQVHGGELDVEIRRLWKNYYKKSPVPVNEFSQAFTE